jgi:hypothetical protein
VFSWGTIILEDGAFVTASGGQGGRGVVGESGGGGGGSGGTIILESPIIEVFGDLTAVGGNGGFVGGGGPSGATGGGAPDLDGDNGACGTTDPSTGSGGGGGAGRIHIATEPGGLSTSDSAINPSIPVCVGRSLECR